MIQVCRLDTMWLQRLQVPCAAQEGLAGWRGHRRDPGQESEDWVSLQPCPLDLNLGGYEVWCFLAGVLWEPVLMKYCCYLVTKLCLTLFVSFVSPWTVAHQATLSMGFPTQKYWIAIPFSRGSSQPKDRNSVSCTGRRVLYHWANREG